MSSAVSDPENASSHKGKRIRSFSVSFKLMVIAEAEASSNRSAAKKFDVDERRIREWRTNKASLVSLNGSSAGKKRKRVDGGGRKPQFQAVDDVVLDWISIRRERGLRVSRKLIMKKAQVVYNELKTTQADTINYYEEFKASTGWLKNFMRRNHLSLCRKTSVAQKDPDRLIAKIVSYVLHVRRLQSRNNYNPCDIIAMDETPVWSDMVSETTVDTTGKKTVTLKTTGHEKSRVSVCLAAKADGTKLKPMIVFKGAKREVAVLRQEFKSKAYIASSSNAWMTTELTNEWVSNVLGSFAFGRRQLAWDSYECHMEDSVVQSLSAKKVDAVNVPGGCTKYIQAPDVLWNKPFKSSCTEKYDEWMGKVGIYSETAAGNLKSPPRRTVIQWILESWADISTELIKKYFPCCGLNLPIDGSDDNKIVCFRDEQPCSSGREMLKTQASMLLEPDDDPFKITESDVEDANDERQIIDSDDETDEDIDID